MDSYAGRLAWARYLAKVNPGRLREYLESFDAAEREKLELGLAGGGRRAVARRS